MARKQAAAKRAGGGGGRGAAKRKLAPGAGAASARGGKSGRKSASKSRGSARKKSVSAARRTSAAAAATRRGGGGGAKSGTGGETRGRADRDFGIPADEATRRARRGEDLGGQRREHRTARAGSGDVPRDSGVGAPDDGPGSHSGGDVSNDFTGVGTGGGVAESGAGGHTSGPEASTGSSAEFASGPPARGTNPSRSRRVRGTTQPARTPGETAGGSPHGAYGDNARTAGAAKSGAIDPRAGGPAGADALDDEDNDRT